MKTIPRLVVRTSALLLLALLSQRVMADVVYDNTTTRSTPARFAQTNGVEFGDEIVLAASGPRILTNFVFEYYGLGFSGDETLRFRLYRNDSPYGTNFSGPGTVLYDSGSFTIGPTTAATLDFQNLNLLVPTNFTWTVQFGGISGSESAGLSLYDPPTIGSSAVDYWERSGTSSWLLYGPTGPALNFGARASAAAASALPDPPVLTSEPSSRTNDYGAAATFSVAVSGTAPFSYVWKKNGTDLTDGGNVSGATTATLTLASVREVDVGSYRVVVTNAAGSATSSNAVLVINVTVLTAPTWLGDGGFQFSFNTAAGVNYTIQYSTWLTNWSSLFTITGSGQLETITDHTVGGSSQRFYQVKAGP